MMQSPSFASGLGLNVHIRTTRIDNELISYSYISAVAVGIGNHVLEAKDDGSVLINGNPLLPSNTDESNFAGFRLTKTIKGSRKKIHIYDLTLSEGGGDDGAFGDDPKSIQIRVNLKTGMLFVDIEGHFNDSIGLMGRAGTTKGFALARDGVTNLAGEWNSYGEDWQVASHETMLFSDKRAPQHPAGCVYQSEQTNTNTYLRRRLMDGSTNAAVVTVEVATKACEHFDGRKKEFCIFDVMATGEIELAEDPFYG